MRLRLQIEVEASADLIEQMRGYVDEQVAVAVDPLDGYGEIAGRIVGAVPVDDVATSIIVVDGPEVMRALDHVRDDARTGR